MHFCASVNGASHVMLIGSLFSGSLGMINGLVFSALPDTLQNSTALGFEAYLKEKEKGTVVPGAEEFFTGLPPMDKSYTNSFSSKMKWSAHTDKLNPWVSRHPSWVFDHRYLWPSHFWVTCVVLFLAGIICSAGGIGGGVYITLLMVVGGLGVHEAVPLSQALVFWGAVPTVVLNVLKDMKDCNNAGEKSIDIKICCLVIASALLGSFVGVFFNGFLSNSGILLVLALVLVLVTSTVIMKFRQQRREEREQDQRHELRSADVTTHLLKSVEVHSSHTIDGMPRPSTCEQSGLEKEPKASHWTDMILPSILLLVVIIFGSFRFHAGACRNSWGPLATAFCNHPTLFYMPQHTLYRWMHGKDVEIVETVSVTLPVVFCAALVVYYTYKLTYQDEWTFMKTAKYGSMSIFAGILSGMIGIGGGLIYSPFFILMGMPPAVAVGTSATCLLYSSAGTTIQFLLTDRIIVSLMTTYGIVILFSALLGTLLTFYINDRFSERKSYITGIVALGVSSSAILSFITVASDLLHK